MKVELTPFQQSQSYTCVATCLRTVLAALSTQYPEDDLARACNTDPSGTTLADAAIAVRSLGFNALFIPETTFEMLTDWLQRGVPMIIDATFFHLYPPFLFEPVSDLFGGLELSTAQTIFERVDIVEKVLNLFKV